MPAVSIITPTYNRPDLLSEAIQSVRAQTFENWEMLIIDDGSQPSAQPIVDAFTDSRLRYTSLGHAGRCAARNHGLKLAQGEFIGFLDDDDLYHPDKLATELTYLYSNPEIDIAGSGYRLVGKDGLVHHVYEPWHTRPELNDHNILFGIPLIPCSTLIKRRVIDNLDYWFDPTFDYGFGDDTDFFIRLFLSGARFGWVKEVLSDYRRLDQRDGTDLVKSWRTYHQIHDKIFQLPNLSPEIISQKQSVLTNLDLHYAWAAYATGAIQTGQRFLLQALIRNPRLAGDQADQAAESLALFSQNKAFVNDPYPFIDQVLSCLPTPLAHLTTQEQSIKQLIARGNHAHG